MINFIYSKYKVIKIIIILNIIIFLIEISTGRKFIYNFGLVPEDIFHKFTLWQIFTYMFLHGNLFHILVNMFILWMFGRNIEEIWGSYKFLKYYFICGIFAGVLILITSPYSDIPNIGASGAIYGILTAFAIIFPDTLIYVYFIFPIKAKYMVILMGFISFLSGISGTEPGISHFGHLGGIVAGYIYLKYDIIIEKLLNSADYLFSKIRKKNKRVYTIDEIDRILDKILIEGVDSLTEKEKKIMDEYTRKK